ncbi:MAG: Iron-sulfur cluster regulator SufR [uncultured Nocardioidaceae bacterium]|uniref:Iron-sulfur cluster regulator SufR n=1 Tax=uncultured Nocardioidaceae bacterium TaxID=253824 RepID=A0A6J4MFV8_9ACTN|nr:MAG: Iron-sulfur cluster regulator SufR [uncultured Nocardioidaceae bacterium]
MSSPAAVSSTAPASSHHSSRHSLRHEALVADGPTRLRVARSLLEHGASTAAELADRLALTAAAVRRHLEHLLDEGSVESRAPRSRGPRGRGRPARVFALTEAGREAFDQAYDDLAASALRFLSATAGEQAVADFARARVSDWEARHGAEVAAAAPEDRAGVLAAALTREGYAASVQSAPSGDQLCQHHCPVAHVAAEFPQLCEAETEAFSRLLGSHVQRLATIGHGDGVCTTHVPATTPGAGPASSLPDASPDSPPSPLRRNLP